MLIIINICKPFFVQNNPKADHYFLLQSSASLTTLSTHNPIQSLTLVFKSESRFVLWMITMEIYCGLVRGGEEGRWDILAAESADYCACIKGPIADLKEIMVGLSGEVEELHVGSWGKKKEGMLRKI